MDSTSPSQSSRKKKRGGRDLMAARQVKSYARGSVPPQESLLPQNLEAEAGVLGSVLIDGEIVGRLAWLESKDFYREAHRIIWEAMQRLFRKGTPPDIISLTDALERAGQIENVGGISYVSSLSSRVPTSLNAEHYARIVAFTGALRRAIQASGEIAAVAYEPPEDMSMEEFRQWAFQRLLSATEMGTERRFRPLADVLRELQEETQRRFELGLKGILIPTGFTGIDQLIVGFEPGESIIIAGRPGTRKSVLGQRILVNMARYIHDSPEGGTCDYVTLEMPGIQQARRMVAAEAHINTLAIRAGFRDPTDLDSEPDDEGYAEFAAKVEEINRELGMVIYVGDDALTIDELRAHVADAVQERDLRVVLIDQLDLMDVPDRETETEIVSAVSKALKQIAKAFNIVVVCLCQLNRAVEGRTDHRPRLSDLRMSGRIEQDNDEVWMIHYPGQYEPERCDPESPDYDPDFASYLEVHILKVRDGRGRKVVRMRCADAFTDLSEWPAGLAFPEIHDGAPGRERTVGSVAPGGADDPIFSPNGHGNTRGQGQGRGAPIGTYSPYSQE